MTIDEAREAIESGRIIQWAGESHVWGVPTSLSDDQSTIYYKPRGAGQLRSSARLDQVELAPWKGRTSCQAK